MIPIQWGIYGVNAVRAQAEISRMWDLGWNTHSIAQATRIPEPRVDRVVTDHITRKRLNRPP